MNEILYVNEKSADYENFYATCPYCGYKNIFNRVSDLGTLEPITFKAVKCFNAECSKNFNINGDLANAAFEMLIFDCYDLLQKKKYSYCILNLAQACEVFFSSFVYVTLAYRPFNRELNSIDELNTVINNIYENTKNFTFQRMKNILLNFVINNIRPIEISESLELIENINLYINQPSRESIESINDVELKAMALELENSGISTLRNNVVHKFAYRPSEIEANSAIEEIRRIIIGLARKLEISGERFYHYQ